MRFFNNALTRNKAFFWVIIYAVVLGVIDGIIAMFPIALIYGMIGIPIISILGIIYEKVKNEKPIWCSIIFSFLSWILFPIIYFICVGSVIEISKLMGRTF